jgi:hypothetical protein
VAECLDALSEKAFTLDILASNLKVHESFAQHKQLSSHNLQQKDERNASSLVTNKSQHMKKDISLCLCATLTFISSTWQSPQPPRSPKVNQRQETNSNDMAC